MTLKSTFYRKLLERGWFPSAPARVEPNPQGGWTWFWDAAAALVKVKMGGQTESAKLDRCVQDVEKKGSVDSPYAVCKAQLDEAFGKVLGSTLKGFKKKEADSSSGFVQLTRETAIKFQSNNLRESEGVVSAEGPSRFKVVLLQEGLGNFGDSFYYSKEALESAIPIFEGAKIFADHPSTTEEQTRPERSVRDVLGHFENVSVQESEDGRSQLAGEVQILPGEPYQWARSVMTHAIDHSKKHPEKEFVGLSINANGDSEEAPIDEVMKAAPESVRPKLMEAKEKGIDTVKVVKNIKSATSCDLVTQAGAGGKIETVIQ